MPPLADYKKQENTKMSSVIPSRFGRLALAVALLTGFAAGAQASTLDKVKDSSSVRIG